MGRKKTYHCRRCLEQIQGDSELCVRCFALLTSPCSACVRLTQSGSWKPKVDNKKRAVDCPVCQNERWVLRDYTPGEAAKKR